MNKINLGHHNPHIYRISFEYISDVPFIVTFFCLPCSSSIKILHIIFFVFIISIYLKNVNICLKKNCIIGAVVTMILNKKGLKT